MHTLRKLLGSVTSRMCPTPLLNGIKDCSVLTYKETFSHLMNWNVDHVGLQLKYDPYTDLLVNTIVK